MPVTISGRPYGLGALIALLVLVLCVALAVVGRVTPLELLGLVAALALAYLIG